MAKITEYPRATKFDANDVLLKDGTNGTKTITVEDFVNDVSGVTEIGFSQVGEYTARPCRLVGSQWVYGKSCHWKVEE